jgi:DNA-binding XRE family transcriptional regulator
LIQIARTTHRWGYTPTFAGTVVMPSDSEDLEPFLEARERLARKMIELRTDAKLSQRQAAADAGIKQATWWRLERRLHDPSLAQLLRIQRLFGLDSLDSFFGPGATARLLGVPEPAVESDVESQHDQP